MPYYNVTPHTLYSYCLQGDEWRGLCDQTRMACAWVQAVNMYDIWQVTDDWFQMIEREEVDQMTPDPNWKDDDHVPLLPITLEVANVYIEEMDKDFAIERNRFPEQNPKLGPAFSRLPSNARIAFLQAIYQIWKTKDVIGDEAERRLAQGEELPPSKNAQTEEVISRLGRSRV